MRLERLRESGVVCFICGRPIAVGELVAPINTNAGFYRVHPPCRERRISQARKRKR